MDSSAQDQNLQALINAAVAASVEKALSWVLPVDPKDRASYEPLRSAEESEDSDPTQSAQTAKTLLERAWSRTPNRK
ncbi:Hypothetical predicted protein, partial [Pelobates cultripes]